MNQASDKWGLTILAAYSQRWSPHVAKEFQDGVSSLLADVERHLPGRHVHRMILIGELNWRGGHADGAGRSGKARMAMEAESPAVAQSDGSVNLR